jgi:pimeloyl-ACP methyl ester carboxylesterase
MTHLGYDIESPVWRHWVRDLAASHTFIRYDERGCGLSDWEAADFTFDDWVTDLESVVEALGLERFPLLGVSQGSAVAVAYAAKHPEQVTKLILCSSYARGRAVRAIDDAERRAAALDLDLARVGWGRDDPAFRQVFAAQFLPDGSRADWRHSTICSAAPRLRTTRWGSSRSSPASTSANWRNGCHVRR